MDVTRRQFVKGTGAATLLAGVPMGWAGGVYAQDGPEAPKVRIGIIALTDCSSIVMAHELGLFKKHGIESTISKEASWAVIRDRLTLGENQATHMLLGIPYASTMGLQGAPVKPMIIPFYLNRNGQAITPPQMVANMKVGKMDGFCVGEPWNARAIADGIGFTVITTQQMWKDHPEKVLAFTEEFAAKNPKTVKAVMRAVLEASQWNDKLDNRPRMAEVVSQPQYINTTREVILGRMLGEYDYGDGRKEKDRYYMTFFDR